MSGPFLDQVFVPDRSCWLTLSIEKRQGYHCRDEDANRDAPQQPLPPVAGARNSLNQERDGDLADSNAEHAQRPGYGIQLQGVGYLSRRQIVKMPCIATGCIHTPHNGDDEVKDLALSASLPVGIDSRERLTSAKQTHQSSHQTFRVSFAREYILPTTKIKEMISKAQVKA